MEQDSDQVAVHLANGQTDRCGCLIAADGLHSAIRGQLFPEARLSYAGRTSWRGIAETQDQVALGVTGQT